MGKLELTVTFESGKTHTPKFYSKPQLNNAFSEQREKMKKVNQCVAWMKSHKLNIGLTSKAPARSKWLFSIHENGSPIKGIPARPALRPALMSATFTKLYKDYMRTAYDCAMDGNLEGVKAAYNTLGMLGVYAIQNRIDSHIPPPNSPITLHGGWMRDKVSGKPIHVKGKSGDTPLVDTGQYRNSFAYEIVYKK